MRSTDSLDQDHRIIEIMLPTVQRLVEASGAPSLDATAAEAAVEFLRTFVDAYHHRKEELHLFRTMELRGVHRDVGLVFHLLEEHGRGRRHVRAMADSLRRLAQADAEAAESFAENAAAYVKLLGHHIREEDAELWPLVARVLTEGDDEELTKHFAEAEQSVLGEEGREGWRTRAAGIAHSAFPSRVSDKEIG